MYRVKNTVTKTGETIMTLTTYLIDINSINFSQRYEYDEQKITTLAHTFLTHGGTTTPLIVKCINMDEYELIEGEIQLLAAIKANQIDDDFEMIRVCIQEDDQNLITQLDLIKEIESSKAFLDKCAKEFEIEDDEVTEEVIVKIPYTYDECVPFEEKLRWLTVNGEYFKLGTYKELSTIEKDLHDNCPKVETTIMSIKSKKELLEKKEDLLNKLKAIQDELDAHDKFFLN